MIILLCVLVGFGILLLIRSIIQRRILRSAERFNSKKGISKVEAVTLGGEKQWILMQGEDFNKPVLLILHGGPGMPIPGVSGRMANYVYGTTTSDLLKNFVLVYWDQRGAGKSYHSQLNEETMNFEQFVSDTNELVDYLRLKFNADKIFLSGLSWGSIVGLKTACTYPEKFYAYAGLSQGINWSEGDKDAYQWAVNRAQELKHKKAIKELKKAGSPPYLNDIREWGTLRKWLMKLGGYVYKDKHVKPPSLAGAFLRLLISPDYKLIEVVRCLTGGMKLSYCDVMIKSIGKVNLQPVVEVNLPVYFFHGKHDQAMSLRVLRDFYATLNAKKGKELFLLPNSAHFYSMEDAQTVEKQLINLFNKVFEEENRPEYFTKIN